MKQTKREKINSVWEMQKEMKEHEKNNLIREGKWQEKRQTEKKENDNKWNIHQIPWERATNSLFVMINADYKLERKGWRNDSDGRQWFAWGCLQSVRNTNQTPSRVPVFLWVWPTSWCPVCVIKTTTALEHVETLQGKCDVHTTLLGLETMPI